MKTLRLLVPGLALAALTATGCVLTSAQILTHFDLPNPFEVNSTLTNHTQEVPIDLNEISDYSDNKDKLKGIVDLAILGKFTNLTSSAGSLSVYITPDLDAPNPIEIADPPGNAVLLWGPGTIGPNATRVIGWDESAGLFNAAGKAMLLDQIKGDGTFTLYTTGSTGTYDIRVDDGELVLTLDAGL